MNDPQSISTDDDAKPRRSGHATIDVARALLSAAALTCYAPLVANPPAYTPDIMAWLADYFGRVDSTLFFLLFIVLLFFYLKLPREGRSKSAVVLGCVFAVVHVLGGSYLYNGEAVFLNGGAPSALAALVCLCGYAILATSIIRLFYAGLDHEAERATGNARISGDASGTVDASGKRKAGFPRFMFEQHPFACCAAVMLVAWLPYLIAVFPGVLHYDGLLSVDEYFGVGEWTTHFPPLSVLIMGKCMELGRMLGSDWAGIGIFAIPQVLLMLGTLAYAFVIMRKLAAPMWCRWFALALFALLPLVPMYAITVVKDTYYYMGTIWLVYGLARLALETASGGKGVSRSTALMLIAGCFLVTSMRNDGKFVCILALAAVVLACRKTNLLKGSVAAIACSTAATLALSGVICAVYGIGSGSMREMMSIPAQQVARTVIYHPDAFDDEQMEELDRLFTGHVDELATLYEPKRSDHVKETFVYSPTAEDLADFASLWLQGLVRAPGSYFSAAFLQNYGYFYLGEGEYYTYGYSMYNFPQADLAASGSTVVIEQGSERDDLRAFLMQVTVGISEMPITAMFYKPAFYTWLMALCIAWLIRRRNYLQCLPFVVPFTVFAICCVSPLSGAFRYSLPITFATTFLLGYILSPALLNPPPYRPPSENRPPQDTSPTQEAAR